MDESLLENTRQKFRPIFSQILKPEKEVEFKKLKVIFTGETLLSENCTRGECDFKR